MVDALSALSAATNAASGASSTSPTSSAVSQDQFLKLLVAQLQHQDPLDPQKGADFVAQLAQFASLEQTAQTNDHLTAIQSGQDSSSRAGLFGMVGKTVTAAADTMTVGAQGATMPSMTAHLNGAAAKSKLVVTDSAGNVVKSIDLGAHAAGDITIPMDPKFTMGAGNYTVKVVATDASGAAVQGSASLSGLATAIEFQNGSTRIRIGGVTVTPASIQSISN